MAGPPERPAAGEGTGTGGAGDADGGTEAGPGEGGGSGAGWRPGGEWGVPGLARDLTRQRRAVRRAGRAPYHCLCSAYADSRFVAELRRLHAGLPVLANLRCGAWYAEGPDGTCYFKSTDGHHGGWAFSFTRLNLHVLPLVARGRGALVVDATRSGKAFPDALSKTVPIWAAVVNRALARQRQRPAAEGEGEGPAAAAGAAAWDAALHLPPWVPEQEATQIRARLDGWTAQLLAFAAQVGFGECAAGLDKPLRPLWISQESTIWPDAIPAPGSLPFLPLYLVSASSAAARSPFSACEDLRHHWEYVQGAGDDHESWALGLTPELFWQHSRELLASGPAGCEAAIRRVVARHRGDPAEGAPGAADDAAGDGRPPEAGAAVWVHNWGIALGAFGAGAPPGAFGPAEDVCVLNCGLKQHALAPRDAPRYAHCPMELSKKRRGAMEAALPAAVSRVEGWRAAGKRVLIHCDDGLDACVCVAICVALRRDAAEAGEELGAPQGGRQVSKDVIRAKLGLLSRAYPTARPSRGSLKQVFNFFNPPHILNKQQLRRAKEQRRAAAGNADDDAASLTE